ncbi:hypothetical protein, partial [Klebsiella aerogenes]|uniref:hypothetical protein n=1 Tax=Klebsiella aerogenes TaxID=548 RepID=UPI0019548C07
YQWRNEYWSLDRIPGLRAHEITGPVDRRASWIPDTPYQLGTSMDFRIGGRTEAYRVRGFSVSEQWGSWT